MRIGGKTGTAQLVNPYTGRYYTDNYNTIKSFVGMWPKDDPQVIIYISAKKITYGTSKPLYGTAKSIITNVSKYLNICEQNKTALQNRYQLLHSSAVRSASMYSDI